MRRRRRPGRPGIRPRAFPPCPCATSSSASTSVSGVEPEVGVADQLGHHAPRPEGDEGAEHRVLRDARQKLDAARDLRLHDHGSTDPSGRGVYGSSVVEVEHDATRLGLVRSRVGRLDDDGVAELVRDDRRLVRRGARRSSTSGSPYASRSRRVAAGSSQASPSPARAVVTTSAAAAVSTSASRGTVPAERRSQVP